MYFFSFFAFFSKLPSAARLSGTKEGRDMLRNEIVAPLDVYNQHIKRLYRIYTFKYVYIIR